MHQPKSNLSLKVARPFYGNSPSVWQRATALAALIPLLAGHWAALRAEEGPGDAAPAAYGKIELIRDTWGIPHIFSSTDPGAMFGLGYASAEERGFQMHFNLRIIQGRLAEVVGERRSTRRRESAVEHDRKMRTFGFYRAARIVAANLDPDTRALLQAYCAGVNAYVANHRSRLHPLFEKFGLQPEPWTPADCLATWWHLGQFFATDGTRELIRYRNLRNPNGGRALPGRGGRPFTPPKPTASWYDDDAAVVVRADVTDEWLKTVQEFMRAHGLERPTNAFGGEEGPKFSHAWVVGGKKTGTGSAALVSDPQTPVRNPSLWMEFHVCGKTFNARGIGVPGSPALLIGWNKNLAWGATALGADQADLFRLKTDPDHPDQYFLDGEWRKMGVVRETIKVKGDAPVGLVVRETLFGPVISPFAFRAPGDPEVALKRVPVCQTNTETVQAAFAMMRANDLHAFTNALSRWQFPSLNLVFGDREGDVGYWLLAAIPLRSSLDAEHGGAAVDGTRSAMDWQGFVPHALLPHVINPARGWIASANHRAIGSFYPAALGLSTGSAGHSVRSWRLYERLQDRDRVKPAEVLAIHYDRVNPARRDIVRAGLHLRDVLKRDLSPEAMLALRRLAPWYARGAKSELSEPGSALADQISTFFRFINTPLAGRYGGGETGIARFLQDLEKRLAADPKAAFDAEEQDYVDQALAGAWESAQQQYGSDPDRWEAEARAQVEKRRMGWFESLDDFGSLDAAGDLFMPALSDVDGGTIYSQAAQSYTQYIPLNDVDAAMSLLPPGHSEWPAPSAKSSTMELWAAGKLHPAPLSRQAVEKVAASHLILAE